MPAQKFELATPVLNEGRSTVELPGTEHARISLKYLYEGGEERFHSHTYEDQTYLVLDGEATFHTADGESWVVRRGEGILMPAATTYRFYRSGDGPAVVLRVGGTTADSFDHYLDGDGVPFTFGGYREPPEAGPAGVWTLDGVRTAAT